MEDLHAAALKGRHCRMPQGFLRRRGLRFWIALLIGVTSAPLLALLLSGAMIDRQGMIAQAENKARDLASLAASQQEAMLAETITTLRVLAKVPSVQDVDPGSCSELLGRIATDAPGLDTMIVADASGDVRCTNENPSGGINVADRAYFNRARLAANNGSAATELIVSRFTGKPMVVVAMPVEGPGRGKVLAASLSLDHLSYLSRYAPKGVGQLALILSTTDGMVLAISPEAPAVQQHAFPGQRLLKAYASSPGRVTTALDASGTSRIFGFAPLQIGDTSLLLAVGLSRSDVLAEANNRLGGGLVLALGGTLIALLLGWSSARSALIKPISTLADAAAGLGTGDLHVRAHARDARREIRILTIAFNRMAHQLALRDSSLAVAQKALRTSEEHHRLLAESATDMITRFDRDFRRTYVSPACQELLGYSAEELVGRTPDQIVHPDDWAIMEAQLHGPLKSGQPTARATFRTKRKDGAYRWLDVSGRRLPADAGFVVVTRDVTARVESEQLLEKANQRLEAMAMEDALTGLANRRRFKEVLSDELRRSRRLRSATSLLMVDADWFKSYNDTYGHPAGDTCLQLIAGAINGVLRRPGDLGARYGGEEFAILLPNTDGPGAMHMATLIRFAVRGLALAHGRSPYSLVTVSIGVATLSADWSGSTEEDLVTAADQALYEAKAAERDTIRVAGQSASQRTEDAGPG